MILTVGEHIEAAHFDYLTKHAHTIKFIFYSFPHINCQFSVHTSLISCFSLFFFFFCHIDRYFERFFCFFVEFGIHVDSCNVILAHSDSPDI
jgi:hypothetical protein